MADPLTVLSAASSVISVLQLAVTLYNIVKGHSAAEFKLADLVADLEDLKLEISKLPREAQNELEESIVNEKLQRVKSFLAEITPQNRTRPSKSHLVKLSIDDSKLTRYIVDIKHCIDKVRHLENRHRFNAIHNDLRRFTLPAPSLSYQSFEGGIGGHDEGYGQEIPPGYIQGVDDSIAAPSQQLNRRVTLPATPTSHLVWDAENASLYAEPEPIAGQDVIPAGEICEPLRDIRSTYDSGYDSLIPSVSNTPYFGGIYGQEQYQHRRGSSSVYSRSSIVSEASINEPISIKAKMYINGKTHLLGRPSFCGSGHYLEWDILGDHVPPQRLTHFRRYSPESDYGGGQEKVNQDTVSNPCQTLTNPSSDAVDRKPGKSSSKQYILNFTPVEAAHTVQITGFDDLTASGPVYGRPYYSFTSSSHRDYVERNILGRAHMKSISTARIRLDATELALDAHLKIFCSIDNDQDPYLEFIADCYHWQLFRYKIRNFMNDVHQGSKPEEIVLRFFQPDVKIDSGSSSKGKASSGKTSSWRSQSRNVKTPRSPSMSTWTIYPNSLGPIPSSEGDRDYKTLTILFKSLRGRDDFIRKCDEFHRSIAAGPMSPTIPENGAE